MAARDTAPARFGVNPQAVPTFLPLPTLVAPLHQGLAFYVLFTLGCVTMSLLGRVVVRACFRALGIRLTVWLVEGPAVILHELAHLATAIVFRHQVIGISLWGAFSRHRAAYVQTAYNPRSLYQSLGVSMIAMAPVLVPMIGLGALLAPHAAAMETWTSRGFLEVIGDWIQRSPPDLFVALYLHVLVSASMRLSAQDWRVYLRGSLLLLPVIIGAAFATHGVGSGHVWPAIPFLAALLGLAISAKLVSLLALTLIGALRPRRREPS